MYSCPACGSQEVDKKDACKCGVDLSLLQCMDSITDVWFNRALEALAENAPGRALEWLSACCVVQPNDAAARRAQAKVWAQLGCWQEAQEALERARLIEPNSLELEEIQDGLKKAKVHEKQKRIIAKKKLSYTYSKRSKRSKKHKKISH